MPLADGGCCATCQRVCASNMSEEAKGAVKELVKHLGGRYTAKMSRANSHLVTRTAMGEKWRAAARFGVRPVTPDWLVDSALAGPPPTFRGFQGKGFGFRNTLHLCLSRQSALPCD